MGTLLQEDLIGLAALAARIKSHRREGSVSVQAVWRWATKGVTVAGGRKVKLETVRLAGRYLTSWPAFTRFIEAQSPRVRAQMPTTRSPITRRRASDRAAAAMEAVGV